MVEWQFPTDVSGQPIGPIFNGQAVQEEMTLQGGTDRLSRNVGKKVPFYEHKTPKVSQISLTLTIKTRLFNVFLASSTQNTD